MKHLLAIGLASVFMTSTAVAHDGQTSAKYQGAESAKRVCMAIVDDNVGQLQSALRSEKFATKRLSNLSDSYLCNDMALADFAVDQHAYQTLQFLAPERLGNVEMEEVAVR